MATPATLGGRSAAGRRWPGPAATAGGTTLRTATPTATVAELAAEFGGEVPELRSLRPTLEDTYLGMVGEQ